MATAEGKFGPITEIRRNGKVVKRIPWLAFRLEEADWRRVKLCADILAVTPSIFHGYSAVAGC